MTYHLTTSHSLDGWDIEADWSYTVDPGYRGSRIEPPEGPSVQDLTLDQVRLEGRVIEWDDNAAWCIRPSDDTLLDHAQECRAAAIADAADHRYQMALEAAE